MTEIESAILIIQDGSCACVSCEDCCCDDCCLTPFDGKAENAITLINQHRVSLAQEYLLLHPEEAFEALL